MEKLTSKEKELVAIGAAIAGNCVPCIEYHIPAAVKAGLTKEQILEAIELSVKVKQVPADKILSVANSLANSIAAPDCPPSCGCHSNNQNPNKSGCC